MLSPTEINHKYPAISDNYVLEFTSCEKCIKVEKLRKVMARNSFGIVRKSTQTLFPQKTFEPAPPRLPVLSYPAVLTLSFRSHFIHYILIIITSTVQTPLL